MTGITKNPTKPRAAPRNSVLLGTPAAWKSKGLRTHGMFDIAAGVARVDIELDPIAVAAHFSRPRSEIACDRIAIRFGK